MNNKTNKSHRKLSKCRVPCMYLYTTTCEYKTHYQNQFQCTKLHFFSIQQIIFFLYDDFCLYVENLRSIFYCCFGCFHIYKYIQVFIEIIRCYSIWFNVYVKHMMYTQIKLLLISFALSSYAINHIAYSIIVCIER